MICWEMNMMLIGINFQDGSFVKKNNLCNFSSRIKSISTPYQRCIWFGILKWCDKMKMYNLLELVTSEKNLDVISVFALQSSPGMGDKD